MHVEISPGAGDDSSWRTSIDINAPDRIRSVSTSDGLESNESMVIGDTIYFSDVERPGYFTSFDRPDTQSAAEDLMALLEAIRDSDDVQVDGNAFVVRLGSEPSTSVTLRIDEVYLVSLRLPAGVDQEFLETLYEFSEFGSAPEVVAPPADRVTEAPITPECLDDGELPEGARLCTGGNLEDPQDVDLPRLDPQTDP